MVGQPIIAVLDEISINNLFFRINLLSAAVDAVQFDFVFDVVAAVDAVDSNFDVVAAVDVINSIFDVVPFVFDAVAVVDVV